MVTKTITTNVETGIKEYALKVKSPNKSNISGIHLWGGGMFIARLQNSLLFINQNQKIQFQNNKIESYIIHIHVCMYTCNWIIRLIPCFISLGHKRR